METKLNDIITVLTNKFGEGEHNYGSVRWTIDDKDVILYETTDIIIYGTMSEYNEQFFNIVGEHFNLYIQRILHIEWEDESETIF